MVQLRASVQRVLESMMGEAERDAYLCQTFLRNGVVCVSWDPALEASDARVADALACASKILWRCKHTPDHPASRAIVDLVNRARDVVGSESRETREIREACDDIVATWTMLSFVQNTPPKTTSNLDIPLRGGVTEESSSFDECFGFRFSFDRSTPPPTT